MRQLISVITSQILNQIKPNEINMVRLESFDSPIIYKSTCIGDLQEKHSALITALFRQNSIAEDLHPRPVEQLDPKV